jgi:hypothetical protein
MDLGEITFEAAKPFEGKTFEVSLPDGNKVSMTLEEVAEYPLRVAHRRRNAPAPSLRVPFSLFFVGPPERILPQGTYTFEHPDLSLQALFIVPVSNDETGTEYEAVFT